MTNLNPHCGKCSQCIDRRFAMIAAGQEHNDPDEAYKVNLFLTNGPLDRTGKWRCLRPVGFDINQMEDVTFFANYGEASRVVGFFRRVGRHRGNSDLGSAPATRFCRLPRLRCNDCIKCSEHSGRAACPWTACFSLVIGDRGGGLTYSLQTPSARQPHCGFERNQDRHRRD